MRNIEPVDSDDMENRKRLTQQGVNYLSVGDYVKCNCGDNFQFDISEVIEVILK